jgi:hypothetical protein
MKRVLASLCLLFLAVSVFGQMAPAAPKPEFYLIHEEVAKPSMLMQYESISREMLSAFTEKNADPKVMGMSLYTTTDFHYVYVVPIPNFGGIDAINQGFMTMAQALGKDRWKDIMSRSNATMSSFNEFVVMGRPDLSYVPATPRVAQADVRFNHWAFYYLDASKAQEDVEQVARDYAALFRSKNIPDPFNVFIAASGNDLPLLIVSVPAKSAADYYNEEERINTILGADVRPLQARAMMNTRKYEVKDARFRPELSYPMPAATTK